MSIMTVKSGAKKMETLNPNDLERLTAEAEVAYAFTKIDIKHFQTAVEKFESVLGRIHQIPDVPESHICSWKFSMALAIRRQLNVFCSPDVQRPSEEESNNEKAMWLYEEIIAMKSSRGNNKYRARACVDIALEIYYKKERTHARNERPSVSDLKNHQEIEEYIDQALHIEPDDDFVLSRSGRYYRRINNPTKAIELLRKAIGKKETSFSHHHLAKALRDQLRKQDECHSKDENVADGLRGDTPLEHNSTRDTSEENYMRELIKSPRKLQFISKDHAEYTQIMDHLDKAFSLNYNIPALYDKGMICLAAKQYTNAIDTFKRIFGLDSCSKVLLADAYEQAAMCLLEEAESIPDLRERNEDDAKYYLSKSLGISSELVRKNPDLTRSWGSSPALRHLLPVIKEPQTTENLREVANIFRNLREPRQAIEYFGRFLSLGEDVNEIKYELVKLAKTCLHDNDHANAILALNMVPFDHANNEILTLHFEAYIKGGIAACRTSEKSLASNNLKSAFDAIVTNDQSSLESTSDSFDMFILSSDVSYDFAVPVCALLKVIGLRVTLNSDDVIPGHHETRSMNKIMGSSKCVAVFLAAEEEDRDIERLQQMFIRGERPIVISESGRATQDPVYRLLPSVPFERALVTGIGRTLEFESLTSEQVSWVEQLLLTIPV